MFIVSITYTAELSEVDKCIDSHIAFLQKYYAENVFIMSGRKEPRDGGIILVDAKSKDHVWNIIHEDPFYVAEVANYEVIEFIPTMTSGAFSEFKRA